MSKPSTHDRSAPAGAELSLTERQREILALVMQGESNKAICRALGLAEPTVKRHVTAILKALKVTNRTQAVVAAGLLGMGNVPSEIKPALAYPEKPSLVVLPFTNLSDDPGQDYFADGMVEDITVALGRIAWLFVIASSSAFTFKGRNVDAKQIGAKLGVRYLLGGSVRKEKARVRIVVQLIDAMLGGQIWANKFEGSPEKVFELQDSVAASVSATIAPTLRSYETEYSRRKPTRNLSAYDLYLRALPPHRDTFAQNQESLRLLYKAIELDPSFGAAYGLAAYCHLMQVVFEWNTPPEHWVKEGVRLAHLAAEKGESDPEALWMAGRTLAALGGEVTRGLALIEKSLALNPNSARAWWVSGMTHAHMGDANTALDHFARARHLNPLDTSEHGHWTGIALAYLFSGNYEAAGEAADRALSDWPSSPSALRLKAAICGLLGMIEEGGEYVRRLLAVNPNVTVASVSALNRLQMRANPIGFDAYLSGLRRAGLPEG